MTLAIDASNLYSGGSKTHLYNFLKFSIKSNNEIIIYCFQDLYELFSDFENDIKFIIIPIKFKKFFFIWQIFCSSILFKKSNVDVLFVPGGIYLGFFRPFKVMCRNMLLFEKSQIDLYGLNDRLIIKLKSWLNLYSYSKSKQIIFISNYAKEYLKKYKYLNNKGTIIHHGVDDYYYNKWKSLEINDNVSFVCNSALEPYKRIIELLDILSNYSTEYHKNVELTIIGGTSNDKYFKMIKKKINHPEYNIKVIIKSNLNKQEIINIYRNSNFFIFPSTCENMPNALIEAQVSGIPIISSNIGSSKEFLRDIDVSFNPLLHVESIKIINKSVLNYTSIKMNSLEFDDNRYSWEKCISKTNKELVCVDLVD
tara:strand:- start:2189 stop:3289 length:1101 start_codon:yes stop_codon:yes gene_type:complete